MRELRICVFVMCVGLLCAVYEAFSCVCVCVCVRVYACMPVCVCVCAHCASCMKMVRWVL